MNKSIILISLLALAGCSVDNPPTEHTYTEQMTDNQELTLAPSDDMKVSFEEMSAIYGSTMKCLGLYAPGPVVEFKSFSENYLGGSWGLYHQDGYIFINTDEKDTSAGFPPRSRDTDTQVLKHEFIHHILYENDIPHHDGESTELFAECGIGVEVNN